MEYYVACIITDIDVMLITSVIFIEVIGYALLEAHYNLSVALSCLCMNTW